MSKSDRFRKQHDDLLELANELAGHLNENDLANNASAARTALSRLSGKLLVHLAMEDEHLYPTLLKSDDTDVKKTAQQFIDEMGGIAAAFTSYTQKWPSASSIQENPAGFIEDTKAIYAALDKRIDQENNILYPLIDRAA